MSGFKNVKVLNICELSLIWQGFEDERGGNFGRVSNIPVFRVCQVSAYANIAEGSEYF